MPFKLSYLNSNLALTLGYLNPALNNSAQAYRQDTKCYHLQPHKNSPTYWKSQTSAIDFVLITCLAASLKMSLSENFQCMFPLRGGGNPEAQRTLITNYIHRLLGDPDSLLIKWQSALGNGSRPPSMEETCGGLLCSRRTMMMMMMMMTVMMRNQVKREEIGIIFVLDMSIDNT